jgi:putative restriction endonuclease
MWLEMSRDAGHGGSGWEFSRWLWSPAYKNDTRRSKWAYWESLLQVRAGDDVLHLRGVGTDAAFVGVSTSATRGFATNDRPSLSGQWSYAQTFYKVPLRDWRQFAEPISLRKVFASWQKELTSYFMTNKRRKGQKQLLFYVHQAGRLQCLNGAYLSQIDEELAKLLLQTGISARGESVESRPNTDVVPTAEAVREIFVRLGQDAFSQAVRSNYDNRCCVPGCDVTDDAFLVGSHIARWADVPSLRGNVRNGLSLCLMHDKAFESGFFTFDGQLRVVIAKNRADDTVWIRKHLVPFAGQKIRAGSIEPSNEALQHHWFRHGFEGLNRT